MSQRSLVAASPPRTRAEKGSCSSLWAEGTCQALGSATATRPRPRVGFLPALLSLLHPFYFSGLFTGLEAAVGGAALGVPAHPWPRGCWTGTGEFLEEQLLNARLHLLPLSSDVFPVTSRRERGASWEPPAPGSPKEVAESLGL